MIEPAPGRSQFADLRPQVHIIGALARGHEVLIGTPDQVFANKAIRRRVRPAHYPPWVQAAARKKKKRAASRQTLQKMEVRAVPESVEDQPGIGDVLRMRELIGVEPMMSFCSDEECVRC